MFLVKFEGTVVRVAGPAFLALLVAVGCAKQGGGGAGGQNAAALAAAGQSIYAANNCARCHALGGQGGRMGPDLTRVGAAPGRTAQWLMEHVRNPKAHNPSSRMPAFSSINDQDLTALGAYLASLR
jgi:cbb3-type cytochrome oxidase cytochrome c subunit